MENSYLLEIGVEELPARFINPGIKQLKEKIEDLLNEEEIDFGEIKLYSTPRRLSILISSLADKQKDKKIELRGPSKRIGYQDGQPTKALIGFMKSQGLNEEDIIIDEYNGEDYCFTRKEVAGRDTKAILAEKLPEIIKSLNFPKNMRWGGKNIRFPRPIRWIVSIFNREVLDFELEGIEVSNKTRGHRFLGSQEITIEDPMEYEEKLKENYVIADSVKRRSIIDKGAIRLARERAGNLIDDEKLLEEINNIVEYPTPLIGRIKEEYLSLPDKVLITPMKEHLRYIPVFDDKGRLLPYFITVRNGDKENIELVTKGNEKVLDARLADSKFFFEEDKKIKLEDYVEELKGVTFYENLGSLYDKSMRLTELVEAIADELEAGEETKTNVVRAAYLSKADLVTKMVIEFPELQGEMGMEYANISGENEVVSLAIKDQYLPRYKGDMIPKTTAGVILSLADKIDSLGGLFAIGVRATGSQDPFGLRRQALGILNTILGFKLNISLEDIIEESLYIYVNDANLVFDGSKVKSDLTEFLKMRLKIIFKDQGFSYDLVDSVVNGIDNIYDMKVKLEEISQWLEGENTDILQNLNRIFNLISDDMEFDLDLDLDLMDEEEKNLYREIVSVENKIINLTNEREYEEALNLLSTLNKPIERFFENVMIMVEDEKLKYNRLKLLEKIYNLTMNIFDISKIVVK